MTYSTSMQRCRGEAFVDMLRERGHCNAPSDKRNIVSPSLAGMWLGGALVSCTSLLKLCDIGQPRSPGRDPEHVMVRRVEGREGACNGNELFH